MKTTFYLAFLVLHKAKWVKLIGKTLQVLKNSLFSGGKLPEELIEIKKKQGSKTLFKTLVPLVNKMGLTKKELEDCFAYKNGSIIDKMDEVLKVLYDDHDIVMITGNSRAYTDNFLKRYGLFELFEEIFAHPETITDQGKIQIISFLYFVKKR